jgi:integral membrane sensor domain MASE1
LSGLIATKIYFYFRDKEPYLRSIRNVLLFCLLAVLWVVSPTIGATSLLINGFVSIDDFTVIWMTWWLGDSIGIMLTTPLLLIISYRHARRSSMTNYPLGLVYLVTAIVASIAVANNQYALLYLLSALCLFSAVSLPQISVIIINMSVAGIGIAATLNGSFGPNHSFSTITQLWLLQLFIATTMVLSLVLWSIVHRNKIVGKKWRLAENKARIDPLVSSPKCDNNF